MEGFPSILLNIAVAMAKRTTRDRTCSFCGREIPYDQFIIGGLDATICEDCIRAAMDIYQEQKAQLNRNDLRDLKTKMMKPKEIKARLDEYVIGQEEAKKTISVAVY